MTPRPLGAISDHVPQPVTAKACTTGKTLYTSRRSAIEALDTLRAKAARQRWQPDRKWPTAVYRCGRCYGWHLTSMPQVEGA